MRKPVASRGVQFCVLVRAFHRIPAIHLLVVLVFTTVYALSAQESSSTVQANPQSSIGSAGNQVQPSQGGMATAGPHEAIFDSQHRPITAGGFVKSGPIVFQDVAAKAGLTRWHHTAGTPEKRLIVEAKGPGVCLLDYDNDGWLDIYLVNGSTYDALAGKATPPHAALFHNNHDGTFTDVTQKAGVANDRWGFGCAVADYDNDGWPDLYVTNYGKNRLYHNNHDGTFTDVAEQAGVALGTWSTGATFGDYDGDGRLDLFVAGYLQLDLANLSESGGKAGSLVCQFRGVPVMCGPRGLQGEHDHLFHNNGDGTFTDVSKKLGVDDPNGYYGLGALFADVNNDGKPDLLVANDSTPNYLYINKGNGTFEDDGYMNGYALNGDGREVANMGIAVGDYENNGHLSVVNTTFADDSTCFSGMMEPEFSTMSAIRPESQSQAFRLLDSGMGFSITTTTAGRICWSSMATFIRKRISTQTGVKAMPSAPCSIHNLKNGKFEAGSGGGGYRPREVNGGPRCSVRRHLQRWQDRRNRQQYGRSSGAAAQCEPRSPPLGRAEADRRPKSPRDAVGATVYLNAKGIRQRERCSEWRQLSFLERHACPLRPGRRH